MLYSFLNTLNIKSVIKNEKSIIEKIEKRFYGSGVQKIVIINQDMRNY